MEPAGPSHDRGAGGTGHTPAITPRTRQNHRLGAQFTRRRRAGHRHVAPRRVQRRPACARGVSRSVENRRIHDLHRQRHRVLGLASSRRAQTRAARGRKQLRTLVPPDGDPRILARPHRAMRRWMSCAPSVSSARSAWSICRNRSCAAIVSMRRCPGNSMRWSTSTGRARSNRSSGPRHGAPTRHRRRSRRASDAENACNPACAVVCRPG